jgi:hypothetical protein
METYSDAAGRRWMISFVFIYARTGSNFQLRWDKRQLLSARFFLHYRRACIFYQASMSPPCSDLKQLELLSLLL